jgi:hypothetical protein
LELGITLVGKRERLRRNGGIKRERCQIRNMICRLTFVVEEKVVARGNYFGRELAMVRVRSLECFIEKRELCL